MSVLQKPMSTHCHSPKIYRDCCRNTIISNSVCKAGRILHERYVVCEGTDCWEVPKTTNSKGFRVKEKDSNRSGPEATGHNHQSLSGLLRGINCPFGGKSRKPIHFNQLSES